MHFTVIGITDNPTPKFSDEILNAIADADIFSGGSRHHAIMAPFLPSGHRWIAIRADINAVMEEYRTSGADEIVVFASGDPLFHGIAVTLRREMPECPLTVMPVFNSLQMLAHRLLMPYHDMRVVSLTGRPWTDFDRALIERSRKIGVLTDKRHTPAAIARRMIDYGFLWYRMMTGEKLGDSKRSRVMNMSLKAAATFDFSQPNCLILVERKEDEEKRVFGIPDEAFTPLDGRRRMITKMPVRLLTLQALDLPRRTVMWDIGFCTGSVSIEARCLFPHLHIEAFEKRGEGERLMEENSRRHHAPGISVRIGDFMYADLTQLPRPDAVFIGGHGGHLPEMMRRVDSVAMSGAVIVMNSVTADSRLAFIAAAVMLGWKVGEPARIAVNDYNTIEIMKAVKP